MGWWWSGAAVRCCGHTWVVREQLLCCDDAGIKQATNRAVFSWAIQSSLGTPQGYISASLNMPSNLGNSRSNASLNSLSAMHLDDGGMNEDYVTLGTFIIDKSHEADDCDLSILIQAVATSCKYVANCVRKCGLADLAGKVGQAGSGEHGEGGEAAGEGAAHTGRCRLY